jgi:hypothetical protein
MVSNKLYVLGFLDCAVGFLNLASLPLFKSADVQLLALVYVDHILLTGSSMAAVNNL